MTNNLQEPTSTTSQKDTHLMTKRTDTSGPGNPAAAKIIQAESDRIWKELTEKEGKSDQTAQPELEKRLLKKLGK